MNRKYLISICIPAYSRPEGLKMAVESIIRQDAFQQGEIEVLIIDDASPCDTKTAINSFLIKYKNIRYLKNKRNLGLEKNILKLLKIN